MATTLFEAGSLSIQLRESKTDQFQRGQIRTHHCTGEEICPVKALQAHGRENSGWVSDPGTLVFQYQGVGITRESISEILRLAAVAEGYPAHLVGSHSLRKGGPTAILSCTDDIEQVKRFGGWKSDAVHAYLYSDHAACPDRARSMLKSAPVLHPPQRTRSRQRPKSFRGKHGPGSASEAPHRSSDLGLLDALKPLRVVGGRGLLQLRRPIASSL